MSGKQHRDSVAQCHFRRGILLATGPALHSGRGLACIQFEDSWHRYACKSDSWQVYALTVFFSGTSALWKQGGLPATGAATLCLIPAKLSSK